MANYEQKENQLIEFDKILSNLCKNSASIFCQWFRQVSYQM